jgi:GH15 family glucan-1,4-alpha-glucosidase
MPRPSPSIGDYALIGDCETAALVSRDGSVDWLCLPRFDSPACFAALVGTPENGRWLISPQGQSRVVRKYRGDSLILETTFHTAGGVVTVIDFMPVRQKNPQIFRIVRGDRGCVRMKMDLVIRFDYGFTVPWVTRERNNVLSAVAGPNRLVLRASVPLRGEELHTVSDFTVSAGKTEYFELEYGRSYDKVPAATRPPIALKSTERWWRQWISRCNYTGRYSDVVRRSLITLKAMTYARTGGIIAAPTTSLPEVPHGDRNWDYRYCWVRDATFALLGFLHTGFYAEASEWKRWLKRSVAGSAQQAQVLYGPSGERLLREWKVPWLSGYCGAKPVRVGNAASKQLQLDLYGEVADVLYQSHVATNEDGGDGDLLVELLENLEKIWRKPDHGIWEVRKEKRQFTHSKVMTWVAFDRAIRSAEQFGVKLPVKEWKDVRQQIHDDVCKNGFNARLGTFVQSYGSREIDASLLLIPLVGFLPPEDRRVKATVRQIEKSLVRGGFLMRYKRSLSSDSSKGYDSEGAFLPCTFWLADYYVLAGNKAKAIRLLQRLLKVRNDVGLLSEEYDPARRRLAGNFPQTLSHVALVNTVVNLFAKRGPARQRSGISGRRSLL